MSKPDCGYFLRKSVDEKSITGYFCERQIICDNYACPANGGKFFSGEMDNYIGFCNVNASLRELEELREIKEKQTGVEQVVEAMPVA